jgi:hypothetical protein
MVNQNKPPMSLKRADFYLLHEMLKLLSNFKPGKTSLMYLVVGLDNLCGQLKSIESDWKKSITMLWRSFEAIYGAIEWKEDVVESYSLSDSIAIKKIIHELKKEIEEKLNSLTLSYCPSCGYDTSDSKLWTDLSLKTDFCDCCGLEFGLDGAPLDIIRKYRDVWLTHPLLWHNPKVLPKDWKIEDQMEHIPLEYL